MLVPFGRLMKGGGRFNRRSTVFYFVISYA